MTCRRAAFVALALFLAACGSDDTESTDAAVAAASESASDPADASGGTEDATTASDETEEPAADAAAETADAENADTNTEDADERDASEEGPVAVAFDPDATPFTGQFQPIDQGSYRVDTLGTPFSVTIEGDWFVQPNDAGQTVFTDPASQGPGDRDIVFLRPSALADPSNPAAPVEEQGEGWPVDDIEGWLDMVIDGVVTGEPETTTLGGRDAVKFSTEITDDGLCGDAFYCVGFVTNNLVNGFTFEPGFSHTIYWVDQGDEAPVMVLIGSPDGNDEWEATAETLLATVAFGEPEPHPIPDGVDLWTIGISAEVPAGPVVIPSLGGLGFTLDTDRFVAQISDNWIAIAADAPADVEIFLAVQTPDGVPLTTIDEVVAALGEADAEVTEVEPTSYPIGEARVFDVVAIGAGGPPPPNVGIGTDDLGAVWGRPDAGRIWIMETDRGVLVVTAESFDGDTHVEAMVELAESILPTLELTDPPVVD